MAGGRPEADFICFSSGFFADGLEPVPKNVEKNLMDSQRGYGRWFLLGSLVLTLTSLRAQDFMLELSLENAHLRHVFLGCAQQATSGYDRRVDDFAPPPGIQTGYVGFLPGVKGLPLYYKDVRGPEEQQEWQLYVKVYEGKPIVVSWDRQGLPADWTFSLTGSTGSIDMAQTGSTTISETQVLKIKGTKRVPVPEATAEGAAKAPADKR